ncbi:Endothelial cell-specific molecule 1 [Branchiostoma belcheri]|nr:Endothelial cell-specific molecule 1 [Branchiostoma belcheri]
MAVNYAVLLLLVLYCLLCRADKFEATNFTVSVAEDAKIGTDVLSLPRLLGTEKAELPCAIVEGDPYGRFYVSNNCTVIVARPLDWSVQSDYLLKILVGGQEDPDHHVVRIRVNVRNVLGYPPVYNKKCETPVNPRGNLSGEFLFSLSLSVEVETTEGDVFFTEKIINKPFEKWDMDDLKVIITGNDNCEVRIAAGIRNLNDLSAAAEIWYGFYRGEDGTVTLSCHAETAFIQSELSIMLLDIREFHIHGNLPYLEQLEIPIPQVLEKLQHSLFIYFLSFNVPTNSRTHYTCKLPIQHRPLSFFKDKDHSVTRLNVRHVETLTMGLSRIGCAPDRYGLLCDQNCICKNGARCHGFNGACKCTDAWQGVACDIPKPGVSAATTPSDPSDIYISANVTVHCKVHHVKATALSLRLPNGSEIVRKNSSGLDQILLNVQPTDNGPYMCKVWDTYGKVFNATVVLDIAKCPPNRKGEFCDETCDCLHGATCDWTSGCVCPAGWTGTRCQATCPNGTYGERCREECRCRNGASCSPSDGKCTCAAGWYGLQCDVPCPQYRHGLRCQQVCTCKNNATCHNVDGSCTCVAPWTGKNCDQVVEQEQVMRPEPLLEIFVPIGSVVALAACVGIILYKKRHLWGVQAGQDDETEAFLELEQVEADLAQTVRPGWLSRWGKTRRHLTLGHLVGMGMFGQVIQANLKTHDCDITVAAKEVRKRDIQCYRNFYREAAILVAVHEDQHHDNLRSNIIQLLGFINESTHKYILMEYATNGNLLRLLRQARRQDGPQSLPRHLRYAVHIARALQELQRLALTHRDVAARNVLITADHVAKLADFGQARDVYTAVQYVPNDKHGIEQPAKPKDNVKNEFEVFPLNWTALESLETGEYTCQSDVWSFGVLLWEIVTMGQEPRYHGNDQPTCQQLARTLRRGIRLRRPPVCSGEIYDVMMSCWRENPPTRPDPDVVEMKLVHLRDAMITPPPESGLLCRANESEGTNFTVSVPEDAKIGTDVVSLPRTEKAELPCVMVEGDPYGRFYVSNNCTVTVARPLDWSVQSEYRLKLRVGGSQETDYYIVRIRVNVRNVLGYPPVYNETCETPVNPSGNRTGEFLFSVLLNVQAETTAGVTLDFIPIGCPPDRYGLLCDQNCICKNGARCHGFNGACKCTDAWQGVVCDIPKPGVSAATTPSDPSDIYISADVTVHCKVHHVNATALSLRLPNGSEIVRKNSSRLEQTLLNIQPKDDGPYMCQVWDNNGRVFNATVVLDIAKCPPNRKGEFCGETCDCLHGATCDWTSGCVCPAGWTGTRCQATCPNGTYGERCREECRCRNGASCSPSDGKCTCAAGWYGLQCDVPCPQYRHGLRCQQVCTCKNNATCHNVDGSCTCVAPWTGKNCDQVVEQEQVMRPEPLLEIFVPIGSVVALAACVGIILYKKRHLWGVQAGQDDETEAFLELEQVEADLAQTVRPGWLSRWGKTRRHLTLGHLVGMGMFGQVIQANLKTHDCDITVAAKEVRKRDIQCYRNFYREAAILVAVHEDQHHDNLRSNIIQLLGFINESTHKYILMEYATNGNLLRLLRQARRQDGPQSLPRHLRYAVHIARALQELQRLALTHRDVAARNVLITADHVAKLADFGQARDVYTAVQYVPNDKHGIEQPAKPKDNVKNEFEVFPLNWTALESLETGEYTCQSDVWSFGVLLWEIVTMGQEPRYHGNDQPTCQQLARTLRRGIRLRRPPVCSGEIYDVMMSCWRENPPTRPDPDVVEMKLVHLRDAMITPPPESGLLCRANESEGTNFTVSVPEDAKIGTDVVSLPRTEKAELPCVMVEGDPYGRFYVSNNCTVTVARPLDWSVQSEYRLKLRVGGSQETDYYIVRIRVNVRNVLGYPPVYNETCETPVNPSGNRTGEFLFSVLLNVQAETTAGVTLDFIPIGCPPDRYGLLCDQNCICKNGARCHGFNGACKCTDAWQGVVCDIPKPGVSAATTPSDPSDIYISADVTVHCKVHHVNATALSLRLPNGSEIVRKNSSRLEQTLLNIQPKDDGPYMCQVWDNNGRVFNATVVLDIAKCPPNRKGEFCGETCDCLHGATCDWRSGCVCPPGWTGTRCQTTCPNGTYGQRCREKCRCRNGASCRPSDGRCTCAAGWYGWQCDVPCPKYRHGLRCQQVCTCKNNATCHNVDGTCTCVAPWTGNNCDQVKEQEQPLLQIFVPIGSFIVLTACVGAILYKKRHLCGVQAGQDDETEAFLELEQVEADLAQTVRPSWLSRWGKTRRHLTLGPLVGMGMFGHVIQAKLKTPAGDITVAAKKVRRRDIQCYRNFYREAAILVAVHEDQHHDNLRSNIIQLLGFINESTHKYILTEYATNGNLLRLLRLARKQDGRQSLPRHLRYAVHIARALQELQRLALTHRDVAARNVLITAHHVAKLADFGQARDVYTAVQYVPNDKHGIEQPAKPKDNVKNEVFPLNWTALESLETGEYTCQSDVWSFGVLLWEIVTMGQEPRYHGNDQPTCQQLARTLRRGIRLRRPPGCSGEMYDVMMSCWQEMPSERPDPDEVEMKLVQLRNAMITVRETTV